MKPSQLETMLGFAVVHREPVLIKGAPGVGKSDIVAQAFKKHNVEMIITHPVVSDPTDYKGLPFASNGEANFLPFGDLKKLITATKPTGFFIDDLGQAPAAVQAAIMQLLLARQINGHKISDHVTFVAATNRKQDRAAVSGILEPVKSRFVTILELEVDTNDWVSWALNNNMPVELTAFVRYRPELLHKFEATNDIINSPSPRTVSNLGRMQQNGLLALDPDPNFAREVMVGAVGEGFTTEYLAFLQIWRDLPNIDKICMSPDTVDVPTQPGVVYATIGALANKMTDLNADNIMKFLDRMPVEISTACVKDAMVKKADVLNMSKGFQRWASKHGNFVLGN